MALTHALLISAILAFGSFFESGQALAANTDSANPIVRLHKESPQTCDQPCDRIAVVFIHGLLGSKKTWEHPSNGAYWPQMLDRDLEIGSTIDVFRIDYDSFLFAESPSVTTVADGIFNKLEPWIDANTYKSIVLIGHSLGGNLARQFLMNVKEVRGDHRDLSLFQLMITLGTPMEGADGATFARIFSANRQLTSLNPMKENDYLDVLRYSDRNLDNKREFYRDDCPPLLLSAAYEKKKWAWEI